MSVIDEVIVNNKEYALSFEGPLPLPPSKQLAVVACMDARLNVPDLLGLRPGEAHVIRNAGGVVTDDTLRSLAISQRLLGTQEIVLVHHTDCGMLTFSDEDFAHTIEEDIGERPGWAARAFADLDDDLRDSIAAIRSSRVVPHVDHVRGFVFDVATGQLREVT